MRTRHLTATALLVVLGLASDAFAFSRSRDPDNGVCVFWGNATFTYRINQNCSADMGDINACVDAVKAGVEVWNEPPCTGMNAVFGGTTPSTEVGFDQDNWNSNINLVVFVESNWPHESSAIALTTTTYNLDAGDIVDTDVEFNGQNFEFDDGSGPTTRMDIQNTMAHEAGHMMGLDHSTNQDATMFATADQGETLKRTLSDDDSDAICFVYPVGGDTPDYTDDSMTTECAGTVTDDDTGCRCGPGAGAGTGLFLVLLAGAALVATLAAGRRKRRKES